MWCANTHLALAVVSDYDASSHWDISSKVFLSTDEEEIIVWSSNFFSRDLGTGPLAAADYQCGLCFPWIQGILTQNVFTDVLSWF